MKQCPRCNTNPTHDEFALCEDCMNEMLLGGPQFTFVPDKNFFKEIGSESNESA